MFCSQFPWSQTALYQVETVPLLPTCGSPHFPLGQGEKQQNCRTLPDLGELGLGDTGWQSRLWFRCLFLARASQSHENKLWMPTVWRAGNRSGRQCVGTGVERWGDAEEGAGGGKGDGTEEAGLKITSTIWLEKIGWVEMFNQVKS